MNSNSWGIPFAVEYLTCRRSSHAVPSPKFHLFLLFGQSNMEGQTVPESVDTITNPRILALGYSECGNPRPVRHFNQWALAVPPLHSCYGFGVGPGDYFSKTMLPWIPADDTIGLIPAAFAGMPIDYFRKTTGTPFTRGDSVNANAYQYTGAYQFMVDRIHLAQQRGVLDGILFLQGESNVGDTSWLRKVKEIVSDLRTELSLPNLPFVAGELSYNSAASAENRYVDSIPVAIVNSALVSANVDSTKYWTEFVDSASIRTGYWTSSTAPGLAGDVHFSLASQRELGKRFASKMKGLLPSAFFTGNVAMLAPRPAIVGVGLRFIGGGKLDLSMDRPGRVSVDVFSASGKFVGSAFHGQVTGSMVLELPQILKAGLYLVRVRSSGTLLAERKVVVQ